MSGPNRNAQDRCKLHLSKLADFARWANSVGFQQLPTKGEYEVLRLKHGESPVLIWHRRDGTDHATSAVREARLVRKWFCARVTTL